MTEILATIRAEFIPQLVMDRSRGVPGAGPAPAPCTVDIVAFGYDGYREPQIGWRLEWPEENEQLTNGGDASQEGRLFFNSYGAMKESTREERIARAESAAYQFLYRRGWWPKRWERESA